jgi:surfactin family lipopeptide synthetase C
MMSQIVLESIYPLSPTQEGLLFHSLQRPEARFYFTQVWFDIEGYLDADLMEEAWAQVVDRHAILRSAFSMRNSERPLQAVFRGLPLEFRRDDWRQLLVSERDQRLAEFLNSDRAQGVDLLKPPLVRCVLLRLAEKLHVFIISFHHILLDGWSLSLLIQEMFDLYRRRVVGEIPALPSTRPYSDYIAWLQRQDTAAPESYWRKTLAGFRAPVQLDFDEGDPQADDNDVADQGLRLSADITEALQEFCRENGLTLNTAVLGAWALLLGRYSVTTDIVFGVVTSGRSINLPGVECMTGLFINTLPVRARILLDCSVVDWLRLLQLDLSEARQYEYSSLGEIHGWSEIPRKTPLFETTVVFENYPVDETLSQAQAGPRIRAAHAIEKPSYPIAVTIGPGAELSIKITHRPKRFSATAINRMLDTFSCLLTQIPENPNQLISELRQLGNLERQIIFGQANGASRKEEAVPVHRLFESRAKQSPETIAVLSECGAMTVAAMNRYANRLARYLKELGAGPGALVGIYLERDWLLLPTLIGIWKAGAAYVPLDPAYPKERLAYMLNDACATVILTQRRLVGELPHVAASVVCLEEEWNRLEAYDSGNPEWVSGPAELAYVIYTSGSSGRPKGVMVNHGGLANYLSWAVENYGVGNGHGAPVHSSLSFDLTVTSLFCPLLAGQPVVMLPQGRELEGLVEMLVSSPRYSFVKLTPAHLQILNQVVPPEVASAVAQVLVIGGEALNYEALQFWQTYAPDTRLINEYGPSETVVGSSVYEVCIAGRGAVPIGRPIANTRLYVLDAELGPVPVGVAGDLYIGGVGVGEGYLNKPALTAEMFVPDPLSDELGARLYRTGDRARWRSDGELEYLGRLDQQIKLRGYRIELGEIEAALVEEAAVRQCVVVVREEMGGEKQLVGYLVLDDERCAEQWSELRQRLERKLPEYMIPSTFVVLDRLPLTLNGKIDRSALPPPDQTRPGFVETDQEYVPPQTHIEQIVANVWEELLMVDRVGLYDNFFDLGGHSLLMLRVHSRLRKMLGREFPFVDLFRYPTVSALADYIDQYESVAAADQDQPSATLHSGSDRATIRLELSRHRFRNDSRAALLRPNNIWGEPD